MQELMVYSGQMDCYENCNEVIGKFLNVQVSSSQVHRLTDTYGKQIGKTIYKDTTLTPLRGEDVLYIEADGSMLLTRERGWKEVKLGRIFKSTDCLHAEGKPGWISNSQYVAHLGGHQKFTAQMEHLIDSYALQKSKLVFITDGAPWLRNWIEDAYPSAGSLLDFYHAAEYLHSFCKEHFRDADEREAWVEQQKTLLLQSKAAERSSIMSGSLIPQKKKQSNSLRIMRQTYTAWITNTTKV